MSGIAGIAERNRAPLVEQMLARMTHRGPAGQQVLETDGGTMGVLWTAPQADSALDGGHGAAVQDAAAGGHLAQAVAEDDGLALVRDPLGVAPLYYGHLADGTLCFSSEVKALLDVTRDVHELPPGHRYDGETLESYYHLPERPLLSADEADVAAELRCRLEDAVGDCLRDADVAGSWLSGGLDSSTMASLASRQVRKLYTFAVGLEGSPDLYYARRVAKFIGSEHRELVVSLSDLLEALPQVIYHLESFDALLVRSSVTNYLVAKLAAQEVDAVFSGEGGDELFAGYAYLKDVSEDRLAEELLDITQRLHNTALQRVDRSAAAHGLLAHVSFLDTRVLEYALQIPITLKLRDGVEKWILREAMADALPEDVLRREKAKFWEGAGVSDLLAHHAESEISDEAFVRERELPNGWQLNSKEELMYYRIFREHFPVDDLSWMGRTKGAPRE